MCRSLTSEWQEHLGKKINDDNNPFKIIDFYSQTGRKVPSGEAGSFADEQNLQQTDTFYDYGDYDDEVVVSSTVTSISSTETPMTTTQEPTSTTTATTTTQEPTSTTTSSPSTTTFEPTTTHTISQLP